jgi:hypothetical protein
MTKMFFKVLAVLTLLVSMTVLPWPGSAAKPQQGEGDAAMLAKMQQINYQLKAMGLHVAVEEINYISFGNGRPANRIHQTGERWVTNDPRRLADGENITYLVDQSDGATSSGLTSTQTEAALDRALATWNDDKCLRKTNIIKRADSGADPDIFDYFLGFGGLGDPFLADIVEAGWLPPAFFEAAGGPGGANGILAFTVTFIFTDDDGNPTDINNDHYLDTALAEVYYNDNFGKPGPRAGNPWGINIALPGIDVQTVGLHENGHALGLGHFGPPPAAVMNPVYAGIRQTPLSTDNAGMCAVWASWPK